MRFPQPANVTQIFIVFRSDVSGASKYPSLLANGL